MKRFILFTLILITCSITTFSQKWLDENLEWYSVPSYFVDDPEVCIIDLTKNMPCNKGNEPFYLFLDKFNRDENFRLSRCKPSEYTLFCTTKTFLSYIIRGIYNIGGFPIKGYSKKVGYDKEYDYTLYEWGFWYYVDRNSIVHSSIFDQEKDYGFISLFQRIDDKWYCTDVYLTDELLKFFTSE